MNRIVRRLGAEPGQQGCVTGEGCPAVFELDGGDFLVVGRRMANRFTFDDIAAAHAAGLAVDSQTETTVIVPRDVLMAARKDIPA
jgi:hypothetical protein